MAITPRTVLSDPINLLMFALGMLALGGLAGIFVGANDDLQRVEQLPADSSNMRDAGAPAPSDGMSAGVTAATADDAKRERLDYTCQLERPAPEWTEAEWLRHLGCMEARGEDVDALVAEVDEALAQTGLTPDLALEKAQYLEDAERLDARIAFLDAAVTELGVSDGELVHELTRALAWRGNPDDMERIRHLQLLSRMLLSDSCEVLQTDVWVRYMLADRMAEAESTAAWEGVEAAIDTYLDNGCHTQLETGQFEADIRDVLAEMVGVGVVAEAINGHDGHSTLIGKAAETSLDLGEPSAFCREAVPAEAGLRTDCAKRVADEVFLAR